MGGVERRKEQIQSKSAKAEEESREGVSRRRVSDGKIG